MQYFCLPKAYKVQIGDWVTVTDNYMGWDHKPFLYIGDSPEPTGTTLTLRSAEDVWGDVDIWDVPEGEPTIS